ncbi:Holliday junction resolvase [Sea otter poxvirus]|uniref:Holliday junction resolvase n=1 Tax=Sea otter poxvirus TaxID=1416741 RepID=A0A2U9QHV4_9POXV|nr:Holliday junction resolvase [Sea otter poxvirus]AWU47157.1 Holliday junction resolvase [Sea otter poxvirus]
MIRKNTTYNNKLIVSAFDIGVKNPARTVLEIHNNKVRILDITKLDWSSNWEQTIARDITTYISDIVLVERQARSSPYIKFVYFIKGLLYNFPSKVYCVSPIMKGSTYRYRKHRSVKLFLSWLQIFGIYDQNISKKKLDDVADSFNMAMRYILTK